VNLQRQIESILDILFQKGFFKMFLHKNIAEFNPRHRGGLKYNREAIFRNP
jgi:hypothetical protein